MKSIITLVAFAIMATPSFAATTKKTTKTVTKTTTKTETVPSHHSAPASSDSSSNYVSHGSSVSHDGINWQAGLGLGTAGSAFHFGVRAQGLVPVSKVEGGEILVGGETGFLFGPSSPSSWIIPIMAEGQFNFKGNGQITPYAGLSMGIGIFHSSGVTATTPAGTVTSGGGTTTDFSMLAKGGIYFGENKKLFAEIPLGTMANAFVIFPTFGMRF